MSTDTTIDLLRLGGIALLGVLAFLAFRRVGNAAVVGPMTFWKTVGAVMIGMLLFSLAAAALYFVFYVLI